MKAEEIRGLSLEDMRARVAELEEERFRLKFRSATETLEDPLRLRSIRRDIARLYTIVREREVGGDAAATATTTTKSGTKRATASKSAGTATTKRAGAKTTAAKKGATKSATKSASKTAAKASSKTASKKASSETAS